MINPGYSYAEIQELNAVLRGHHRIFVKVHLLDNAGNFLYDVSTRLVAGVLDFDSDADVTRSGSATILDPLNEFGLDNLALGYQLYNRQVRLMYGVESMSYASKRWWFTIFTGPVTKASRSSLSIDLEFAGKEEFSSEALRVDYTWPAGWGILDVIRNALQVHSGENQFNFQAATLGQLNEPFTVEKGGDLFSSLRSLALSRGARMFYDGEGAVVIRPVNFFGVPLWSIDSTWLTTEPQVSFNIDSVINNVVVVGANLSEDSPLTFEVVAPVENPYSPQSLSRNGVPRYLTDVIEDDKIKSYSEAYTRAAARLADGLSRAVSITTTSAIIPYVEEWDIYQVQHPKFSGSGMMTQASIPLVGDAEMSLGYLSSTSGGDFGSARYKSEASRSDFLRDAGLRSAHAKGAADKLRKARKKEKKAIRKAKRAGGAQIIQVKYTKKKNKSNGGGKGKGKGKGKK